MLLDSSYFLFCFFDEIDAIVSPFSWFNPIQRSPALSAIQGFKRSHPKALLITIVIGKPG
jgi:hypothetical protein